MIHWALKEIRVSHWNLTHSPLGGTLTQRLLGLTFRVSDSAGLDWGLRVCISNMSSGDTDAAGSGNHPSHFENHWVSRGPILKHFSKNVSDARGRRRGEF